MKFQVTIPSVNAANKIDFCPVNPCYLSSYDTLTAASSLDDVNTNITGYYTWKKLQRTLISSVNATSLVSTGTIPGAVASTVLAAELEFELSHDTVVNLAREYDKAIHGNAIPSPVMTYADGNSIPAEVYVMFDGQTYFTLQSRPANGIKPSKFITTQYSYIDDDSVEHFSVDKNGDPVTYDVINPTWAIVPSVNEIAQAKLVLQKYVADAMHSYEQPAGDTSSADQGELIYLFSAITARGYTAAGGREDTASTAMLHYSASNVVLNSDDTAFSTLTTKHIA